MSVSHTSPSRLTSYDVRLQDRDGRGRCTVRIAAINATEARAQAEDCFSGWMVHRIRRSDYAFGPAERSRRARWIAGER